jgi:two-component system response regulator AtoC
MTSNEQARSSFFTSCSHKMNEIMEITQKVAPYKTTILIEGESGTGKELLARSIHQLSPRKDNPFIALNCGAIPENLLESELFGHKKGAFTDAIRDKRGLFLEADGGTLFLDEIGELPQHLQVKLLRVLQEEEIRPVGDVATLPVNVRIIAATLRDLESDINEERFRDDLFFRLNVVHIKVPPLRERSEDIPMLVAHFIDKFSKKLKLSPKTIAPGILEKLVQYNWPGNIRELENCIERLMIVSETNIIEESSLPKHLVEKQQTDIIKSDSKLSIKFHTRILEEELIRKALQKTEGNRTHAAKLLEISHRTLLYKLKEYNLDD